MNDKKADKPANIPGMPDTMLLSLASLLEKGTLLRDTIKRLSLTPGTPFLITKRCTDGTFQEGDLIFLETGNDIVCPKTGRRISPGQCTPENMDFECHVLSR